MVKRKQYRIKYLQHGHWTSVYKPIVEDEEKALRFFKEFCQRHSKINCELVEEEISVKQKVIKKRIF